MSAATSVAASRATVSTVRTAWEAQGMALVSTSRKPNADDVAKAIKTYMSPKATATKRAQLLADNELFAGGYFITTNKKVRPAILPIETETTDEEDRTSRAFLANGSDRLEILTPQRLGDLTMNFFTVISGQQPGAVSDLFTKNVGKAFTLPEIQETAPVLYDCLKAKEERDALNNEGTEESKATEEAEAEAPTTYYRIVCMPVAMPIVYGNPIYRGDINDECVEAMQCNIESSVLWLEAMMTWDENVHNGIVLGRNQLGNKVPGTSARTGSQSISAYPFFELGVVDDDDDETIDVLDALKKRLFAIKSSIQPAAGVVGMELPAQAQEEEASIMTDVNNDNRSFSIPRKPRVQIASYTEDDHLVAKMCLALSGFNSETKELIPGTLTQEIEYVLAIQGKEHRNRALASTLTTYTNEASLGNDFVARAVDLPAFDPATVANLLNSRYDPNTPWTDIEIAPSRRQTAFRIAFAAPDTKQVEQQRAKAESTRTIEELLGQDAINLSKVNSTIHYNSDMFNLSSFLCTMANLSGIIECMAETDREDLQNPKNPLFYRFTRGVSCRLTSPFGKRFMKMIDPSRSHHLFCYLSQQTDTLHGLTVFSVTQPRYVLYMLSNRIAEIPKASFEQAVARIDEVLERLDKVLSNTEAVPSCPLTVAYDNRRAKLSMDLLKQEERSNKRSRNSDERTPSDSTKGHKDTPKSDQKVRDTSGCIVYSGASAFMPFVSETDVSKRRCIPHIRKGSACKKPPGKCNNCHEKDPLKWDPCITKSWNNLIEANDDMAWDPSVDQEKLRAHIARALQAKRAIAISPYPASSARPAKRCKTDEVLFKGNLHDILYRKKVLPLPGQPQLPHRQVAQCMVRKMAQKQQHKRSIETHFQVELKSRIAKIAKPTKKPKIASKAQLSHLRAFNKKYLGISNYDETAAALGEIYYHNICNLNDIRGDIWTTDLPTRSQLLRGPFGRPDINHSFNQEACLETTLLPILSSGFLSPSDMISVLDTHPLINHLAASAVGYASYDFRWIREYNLDWEKQTAIDPDRVTALTAALFHYGLDHSLVMRYLGKNFTGEHRDIEAVVNLLTKQNIDKTLIEKYVRVMKVGCPNHFVAFTSRDNALEYFRRRNGPTIDRKLDQVRKNMNKEDKNNFVIPLPHWVARYMPHMFFTPQHILEKPGKKDRQIFDGSKRYTPTSTPLNMMTSTPFGTEEDCKFGSARERILQRIYNLRVSYPDKDIIVHANDVKSCFRQVKLHPDIMGAFSYIISDVLYLSCGLPFGTDFSPQNWEPVRQILEILAEKLFSDKTLRSKHRKYLDQLVFDRSLGSKKRARTFTKAKRDSLNPGVVLDGAPSDTPHNFYVDDDVYSEMWDIERVEQAVAASIEAVFILLGPSNLRVRQDPVSFDKVIEMVVSYLNKVLGHIINTRKLTMEPPTEYINEVLTTLRKTWGTHRKRFDTQMASELAGKLNHVALTAPWLQYLMPQLYLSLATALRMNQEEEIRTSKSFRLALRKIHQAPPTPEGEKEKSFYQSETAKLVHHKRTQYNINKSLRKELALVRKALEDSTIAKSSPISHLIPRTPVSVPCCDSSLHAAGGFSAELGFWWYLEWSPEVQQRSLKVIKDNQNGDLIDINVLEYASIIVTYLLCRLEIARQGILQDDPNPVVNIKGDNTCAESWAKKGSKKSTMGRALGRILAALLINSPVGLKVEHISTTANVVADKISRIKHESHLAIEIPKIQAEYPELRGCRRLTLNSCQTSCIMEAILQADCKDPLAISSRLLTSLVETTS